MARRSREAIGGNTAQQLQAESDLDPADVSIFHGDADSVVDLILNVTRLEPAAMAGFCGQLNISSDEAYKIVSLMLERWGGGLFKVQALKRNPNNKMTFGETRRIKIAGEPINNVVPIRPPPQPMPVPQPSPAAAAPQHMQFGGYPWPYPYPPQQPAAAPTADPWAMMTQAIELMKQMQPQAPVPMAAPTADDMAKLVASLSTTVKENAKPDDGFANLEKALKLIEQLRGKTKQTAAKAEDDDEPSPMWFKIAERILTSQQAAPQPQQTRLRVPPPPPGYAFDPKLGRYVVMPTATPTKPPERQARENRETIPDLDEDSADDENEDDDEDESSDEEEPLKAEEAFGEFLAMDPDEQQKLLQMVLHNAENPVAVPNGH